MKKVLPFFLFPLLLYACNTTQITPSPVSSLTTTLLPPAETATESLAASPTPSPKAELALTLDPGTILFSVYPYGEIQTIQTDGSNLTTLLDMPKTQDINNNRHAMWIPDGSGISYTVDNFSSAEIWRMNPDGSDQQLLISNAATDSSHAWSPDCKTIAYVSSNHHILLFNLNEQSESPLTDGDLRMEGDPNWSPDEAQLVFSAIGGGGNQDIYTINVDGSNLTQITSHPDNDLYPAWSPDGNTIAFSSTRDGDFIKDIYSIDLAKGTEEQGNTPVQLTFAETNDIAPSWSPDGAYLVYGSHESGGAHATLWIINSSGEKSVQLTEKNTYHSPQWKP